MRLASYQWGCFVLQGANSNTLYIFFIGILSHVLFGQSLEGFAIEGSFDGSISLTFLEGVPKWSGGITMISKQAGLPDPPIFLAVSDLVTGLLFFLPLCSGGSYGLLFLPDFSVILRGLRIFRLDCFTNASNALLSILSDYYFWWSILEKALMGCLPISLSVFHL